MTVTDRRGGSLPRGPATVELDDIQATVLRYRPEPYYGTHVMLHVEDAQSTSASASSAIREEAWRRAMDTARRHYEGRPGLTVVTAQDFGAQPGDLKPAWVPRLDRSTRHRGQRRRAAARSGTGDQGRRVHPWLPRGGRRTASDSSTRCHRTEWHLRRTPQIPVSSRGLQPLPANERSDRRRAGAARGEASRALAQRCAVDPRARSRRPGAWCRPATEQ
jgi:hypothetical protein